MLATEAYIGLGSNLADPIHQITRAIHRISLSPSMTLVNTSSLYRSAAQGYTQQPDFINAVIQITTTYTALQLLEACQAIEQEFGRQRWFQDAPRTLDIDLLLYGQDTYQQPQLTLPHPRMWQRHFVLIPLYEIAPTLQIPGHGALADRVAQIPQQGLDKISSFPT